MIVLSAVDEDKVVHFIITYIKFEQVFPSCLTFSLPEALVDFELNVANEPSSLHF